jgi:hypothetical protein
MKRRTRWALGAALLAVAVGLTVPAFVGAKPDLSATVRFGNPTVGSPFQPPVFDHDASSTAADTLIPQTSVIAAGGNVTFDIAGFHQAMIYGPGTTLDDIDVPPFPPESNILINEDEGLLASSPIPFGGFQGPWTPDSDTFEEPGRYLVLCNVTPHVVFGKMYGWVNVK